MCRPSEGCMLRPETHAGFTAEALSNAEPQLALHLLFRRLQHLWILNGWCLCWRQEVPDWRRISGLVFVRWSTLRGRQPLHESAAWLSCRFLCVQGGQALE